MVVPPASNTSDPVKVPNADHPVKYRIKLTRCLLFYIFVPAIPVSLLVLGFLYLMNTPPAIQPPSLPSTAAAQQHQKPKEVLIERLPHDLKPSLYIITLQTFLPYKPGVDFGPQNRTVGGRVFISFYCQKETNKIILNANDLIIDQSKLRLHDQDTKKQLVVTLADIRNETHIMEFVTEPPMSVGHNYSVKIIYGTRMLEPIDAGLFLDVYRHGNETRYHMVSQMQPIHARRVFPCFDEPEFKAEFQINVIHPRGTTAVSNTKLQSLTQLRDKDWLQSEFHPTPKMSTYLLAVAVTDFPFIETYYRDIRIRVWAPADIINYTYHALEILPKVLNYYENYFDILYPLPKLDVYAVNELRVAAMENWGLITARVENLVFHENTTSIQAKIYVETTLFHEVAHMWFGNLITMRWWNDLWLNEGFATHLTQCAAKNLTYEKDAMESLNQYRTLQMMRADERLNNPPLSFEVMKKHEITTAFHGLTYFKGAAVLLQLETLVGPHRFQRALRDFILKHIYDNADSDDLIRSIIKSLGKSDPFGKHDVDASIRSWTHNRGFPLVTSTRINSTSILLSQQCSTDRNVKTVPNHTWTIPIYYKKDFYQKNMDVVMLHGNDTLVLHNVAILDPEYTGYFYIFYDTQTFEGIVRQLLKDHTVIPARTRAKLVCDTLNSVQANRTGLKRILDIVQYFKEENIEFPFQILNVVIEFLYHTFSGDEDIHKQLKTFWASILAGPLQRHLARPLADQRRFESVGRVLIVRTCLFDHTPCIDYVRDQFSKLKIACATKKLSDSCNFIIPGYREGVYAMALRHGTVDDFEFLWDKLMIETVLMEKHHIGHGLSGTLNETLAIRSFDYQSFNVTPYDKAFCTSFWTMGTLDIIRPHVVKQVRKLLKMPGAIEYARKCIAIVFTIRVNDYYVKQFDDFVSDHADLKNHVLMRSHNMFRSNIKWMAEFRDRYALMLTSYLHEFNNRYQKQAQNQTYPL